MIQLDHKCIDETEAAVRRLAGVARKEPLFDAAAQAQALDRPKVFLAALDQVRTALDEAERAYRDGLDRAGVDLDGYDQKTAGIRAALAAYPLESLIGARR